MDIYSFSDLLYALAKQENKVLKSYGIQHHPTIGNQYEGLTAEILNKSIFRDLHLTVAKNSFIEGSNTEYDIILADSTGFTSWNGKYQAVFVDITLAKNTLWDGFNIVKEIEERQLIDLHKVVVMTGNSKVEEKLNEMGIDTDVVNHV